MALNIIVTNAGRAALVNASKNGTAPVTISHVGISASAVTPSKTATTLPGEIKRIATLSGDVVAGDTIHLVVRDESNGVYTLRSFALYLADGTLFAIYGQPADILEKSSQALMLLAIDVQFADIATTQLTFGDTNFLNPPATTERQGVVELATEAEARAGVDALRALTPSAAKAAILSWLLAQDGAGSGIDADLLDGQQGAFYADVPARLGYSPANRAGDTFTGLVSVRGTGTAAGFRMQNAVAGRDYRWVQKDNGWAYLTDEGAAAERLAISPGGQFQCGGSLVWHAGNDGAGSGLDADTVDGIQANDLFKAWTGRWLTDAGGSARFYFQQGGETFARVNGYFSWQNNAAFNVARMDEAGNFSISGRFDADAVEVRSNGTGAAIKIGDDAFIGDVNQLNTVSIRGVADWSAGFVTFGQSPHGLGCNAGDWTLRYGGNQVWHAGNDGAGSGLDADMLDGLQASDFLRQLGGDIGSNGYIRLNNGLLLQWGRWQSSMSAGAPVTVTFPVAFSAEPFSLMLLPVVTDAATISVWSSDGITGTNFPGRCSRGNIGCRFFAIGPV